MAVHIGSIIAERLVKVGMTKSELARRINKARQNINDILNRKSIDTGLLLDLCRALDHDFFQYYVLELNENNMVSEPSAEYASLRDQLKQYEHSETLLSKELEAAKKEISYLQEIIELLKLKHQ